MVEFPAQKSQKCSFIIVFTVILLVSSISIFTFQTGFFLKRSQIDAFSNCSILPNGSHSSHQQDGCWLPKKYDRLVIMVVDALRFDFAVWDPYVDPKTSEKKGTFSSIIKSPETFGGQPWFRNRIPILKQLLDSFPSQTLLMNTFSDPPTTTMQRLKGITTGSMPTFLEMANNFDSESLKEDNLVDQWVKTNLTISFTGDDTWLHLFPNQFHRHFEYGSFVVKDTETVDNACISRMIPEILRKPGHQAPDMDEISKSLLRTATYTQPNAWKNHKNPIQDDSSSIVIGHFLGVDHVGHTWGPVVPLIGTKLNQVDHQVRHIVSTIDKLDERVLFVLMGDHGMSNEGNHGGATIEEVEAATFFYSNKPMYKTTILDLESLTGRKYIVPQPMKKTNEHQVFESYPHFTERFQHLYSKSSQIDLVPTWSLLLGTPIPFGSVGNILLDVYLPWQEIIVLSGSDSSSESIYLEDLRIDIEQQISLEKLEKFGNKIMERNALGKNTHNSKQFDQLMEDCDQALQALQITVDQLVRFTFEYFSTVDPALEKRIVDLENFIALDSTRSNLTHTLQAIFYSDQISKAITSICRRQWTMFDTWTMWAGNALFISLLGLIFILIWQYLILEDTIAQDSLFSLALNPIQPIPLLLDILSPFVLSFGTAILIDILIVNPKIINVPDIEKNLADKIVTMLQLLPILFPKSLLNSQLVNWRILRVGFIFSTLVTVRWIINGLNYFSSAAEYASLQKNKILSKLTGAKPVKSMRWSRSVVIVVVTTALHYLSLMSNSFIVTEERVVLFCIKSIFMVYLLISIGHKRYKPILYSFLILCTAAFILPQHTLDRVLAQEINLTGDPDLVEQSSPSRSAINDPLSTFGGLIIFILGIMFVNQRTLSVQKKLLLLFQFLCIGSYWSLNYLKLSQDFLLVDLWLPRLIFITTALSLLGSLILAPTPIIFFHWLTFLSPLFILLNGPSSPIVFCVLGFWILAFPQVVVHYDPRSAWFVLPLLARFFSWVFFFSTGHHTTITSLQIWVCSIGTSGFSMFTHGLLLSINTYGTSLFSALVLMHWMWKTPVDQHLVAQERAQKRLIRNYGNSSISLVQITQVISHFGIPLLIYILSHGINCAITMIFTTFQRRHLMSFAIFAPKLMFDVVLFAANLICSFLSMFILIFSWNRYMNFGQLKQPQFK